jgi:hypothetical protein
MLCSRPFSFAYCLRKRTSPHALTATATATPASRLGPKRAGWAMLGTAAHRKAPQTVPIAMLAGSCVHGPRLCVDGSTRKNQANIMEGRLTMARLWTMLDMLAHECSIGTTVVAAQALIPTACRMARYRHHVRRTSMYGKCGVVKHTMYMAHLRSQGAHVKESSACSATGSMLHLHTGLRLAGWMGARTASQAQHRIDTAPAWPSTTSATTLSAS